MKSHHHVLSYVTEIRHDEKISGIKNNNCKSYYFFGSCSINSFKLLTT